jgi:hypothetical protein
MVIQFWMNLYLLYDKISSSLKIRSHLFGLWELSLVNILLLSVDLRLHSLTYDILWMSSLLNHNHNLFLILCFSNTSATVIWVLVRHRLFRFQLLNVLHSHHKGSLQTILPHLSVVALLRFQLSSRSKSSSVLYCCSELLQFLSTWGVQVSR